MKTYFVTAGGVTIQAREDNLTQWVDFMLERGYVPMISATIPETLKEVASCLDSKK